MTLGTSELTIAQPPPRCQVVVPPRSLASLLPHTTQHIHTRHEPKRPEHHTHNTYTPAKSNTTHHAEGTDNTVAQMAVVNTVQVVHQRLCDSSLLVNKKVAVISSCDIRVSVAVTGTLLNR